MELKIEYLPIEELKPYANNAKEHPAKQIEQIKKSIREFGFDDPIGIWKDTIVEGHGRLIAAMELEMETVPCIRLDHLTDEQRKAYALVHNKLTMNSDFNLDLLQMELDDINIDMTDFGFDIDEEEGEPGDTAAKYSEKISVVIDCENDEQAEEIFNRLTEEGYECRISTL